MYNYGARFFDPSIGRFTTTDRFAEKYVGMNPYQYGANNPIKFVDINGDSLRVSYTGQHAEYAKRALYGILNNALEGQYTVSETSTGNLQLIVNCGDESSKGLSKQGQAVLKELNSLFNSEEQTEIIADFGRSDIHTGSHELGTIDVADMLQFNSSKSKLGGTQIGKVVHEFVEQREKQNSFSSSFGPNHAAAIKAEDRVNFSSRSPDYRSNNKSQLFKRGDHTVRTSIFTKGRFGSQRRVISVTNTKL